jgi:hypothetical protein
MRDRSTNNSKRRILHSQLPKSGQPLACSKTQLTYEISKTLPPVVRLSCIAFLAASPSPRLYEARAMGKFGDAARWPEMLSHLPLGRPANLGEIADLVHLASKSLYLAILGEAGRINCLDGVS